QLRYEQVPEGTFELADCVRAEAAPGKTDRVQAVEPGAVANGFGERERVLGHDGIAADKRVAADAAELVDAGGRADLPKILDDHVSAGRRAGAEDHAVADVAVVGDVRVRHDEVVVTDRGLASAAPRAAVDRDELPERVAPADRQPRALAFVFEVLRRQ